MTLIRQSLILLILILGTNGKTNDEESSESEEAETHVKTPKNKKATTTPQTFPKANRKVRPVTWAVLSGCVHNCHIWSG